MLVQAGASVKVRQSGQGLLGNLVSSRRSGRGEIADSSGEFSQGEGEQKDLWREEASSQLAFRSTFMNCRSALPEERGVA